MKSLAIRLSRALLLPFWLLAYLLPLAANAATSSHLVEDQDYVVIDGGQPWQPLDGKIEVVEVFAYWCPHCAEFQPALSAWVRKLPADVRFTYLPAVFDPNDNFARAFFAAAQAGATSHTHEGLYRAVHTDGLLARNATVDELAFYYGQHGLNAAVMKTAMTGPTVAAQVQAARDFAVRSGVPGTPALIVNGRYRIQTHSHEEELRITDELIAQLRAAQSPSHPPYSSSSPSRRPNR